MKAQTVHYLLVGEGRKPVRDITFTRLSRAYDQPLGASMICECLGPALIIHSLSAPAPLVIYKGANGQPSSLVRQENKEI